MMEYLYLLDRSVQTLPTIHLVGGIIGSSWLKATVTLMTITTFTNYFHSKVFHTYGLVSCIHSNNINRIISFQTSTQSKQYVIKQTSFRALCRTKRMLKLIHNQATYVEYIARQEILLYC